jgi:hypothetical protein
MNTIVHTLIRNTVMWLVCVFAAYDALAQCGDKKGFAKQLCEAKANAGGTALSGAGDTVMAQFKGAPLTTSIADAIHLEVLPPSIEPPSFEPLLKLQRADDGAFILKPGIYEAYLESYSLEPYDQGYPRGMAFFPAPIKGRLAKVISQILQYAELHPDVQQAYIQNLLGLMVYGTDLDKMPPLTQQAAAKLLPKDTLLMLHGAAQANKVRDFLLKELGRQAGANDGKAAQQIAGAVAKEQQLDKQYGVTSMLGALKGQGTAGAIPADSAPRGSWAQMPGGFYVRYLPESYVRTKLQVIVPEAAMEHVDPKAPLTFDPTQYLAVHVGTPAQRLGITLRLVGGR